MTPKVYFYATDSHTETSIKDFLLKINPGITWIPRSPRLAKRPKRDYAIKDTLPVLTGRTGIALEKFMLDEITQHPGIVLECPAVLLEDDLDMRDSLEKQEEFLSMQQKKLVPHGVNKAPRK